jgi:hypothetical protein
VDKPRKLARRLLMALAIPVVVLVAVPLAVVAALGFYLLAMVHGFWLLCRAPFQWLRGVKDQAEPRKPHFLETRAPTHPVD